jgi:hypothetical protein
VLSVVEVQVNSMRLEANADSRNERLWNARAIVAENCDCKYLSDRAADSGFDRRLRRLGLGYGQRYQKQADWQTNLN